MVWTNKILKINAAYELVSVSCNPLRRTDTEQLCHAILACNGCRATFARHDLTLRAYTAATSRCAVSCIALTRWQSKSMLTRVQRLLLEAKRIRVHYMNYFVHEEAVPWQKCMERENRYACINITDFYI